MGLCLSPETRGIYSQGLKNKFYNFNFSHFMMTLPFFYRKFIALFIAFSLVVPGFYTAVQTQRVMAQEALFFPQIIQIVYAIIDVLYTIYSYAEEVIIKNQTTITAVKTTYLALKESVLDPIARALSAILSNRLVNMMFSFIASGNSGAPAFLTNPQQFFGNVAQESTSVFLTDLERNTPNMLPSIRNMVKQRIIEGDYVNAQKMLRSTFPGGEAGYQTYTENPSQCSTGNSWDCYFSSLKPQNDPWQVYQIEKEKLESKKITDVKLAQDEIQAGSGYHTLKECVEKDLDQNCVNYLTKIPGGDLVRQANEYMQNAVKLLQAADEVDEVVIGGVAAVEDWMNSEGLTTNGG
jgi:hypothetical protein